MIRCVCFDLGGVLVQIRPTWQQAVDSCGLSAEIDEHLLDDQPEFRQYQLGSIDDDTYLTAISKMLFGKDTEVEMAKQVHNAILVGPYPGTFDLVKEIQELGIDTGCLSNTNSIHWKKLNDPAFTPAIARLHHKLGSQIEHVAKPDPEIFRRFEHLSGVKKDEIVYFEDTDRYVEAAKSLGWTAHKIDPSKSTVSQMRTFLKTFDLLK